MGTGTLVIERKFSHNLGKVLENLKTKNFIENLMKIGKIEDVIIDPYHSNRGLEAQ